MVDLSRYIFIMFVSVPLKMPCLKMFLWLWQKYLKIGLNNKFALNCWILTFIERRNGFLFVKWCIVIVKIFQMNLTNMSPSDLILLSCVLGLRHWVVFITLSDVNGTDLSTLRGKQLFFSNVLKIWRPFIRRPNYFLVTWEVQQHFFDLELNMLVCKDQS